MIAKIMVRDPDTLAREVGTVSWDGSSIRLEKLPRAIVSLIHELDFEESEEFVASLPDRLCGGRIWAVV